MVNRKNYLICKTKKHLYNFQHFETIKSFANKIFASKIALDDLNKDQIDLLLEAVKLNKDTKPKEIVRKKEKEIFVRA